MNGLLGNWQDPRQAGLLALAAGLLKGSAPTRNPQGFGANVGNAMLMGQQAAQQTDQLGQQRQFLDQKMQSMQAGDMQNRQLFDLKMREFAESQRKTAEQQAAYAELRKTIPPALLPAFDANPEAFVKPTNIAPGGALTVGGQVVAERPFKPDGMPTSFQEYEQAKREGFAGTYADWKKISSPSTNINLSPTSPGEKKADEKFAEDYIEFATGGYADTVKQLGQLQDSVATLETAPEGSITGPKVGILPRQALAVVNPLAANTMEQVEEVVQRNLRLILGAQFTEKEGERLIARAYNPYLTQAQNATRLKRLIQQIQTAAEAKNDASQYFRKHGTLKGWEGKLPTLEDFRSMKFDDGGEGKPKAPTVIKYDAQGNRISQ